MVKKNLHFIFWTATGAALGAMLREGLIYQLDVAHPWILVSAINMLGTFIIAVVYEIEHILHENVTIFATIGFCGGFTTFSHFSHHTVTALMNGDYITPFLNIFISLVGTLLAGYFGIIIVDAIAKLRGKV